MQQEFHYFTQRNNETPAAFSERRAELGDRIPVEHLVIIKNDDALAAAIMYNGASDNYNPAKC